jgi:hypothetical protein
MMKSGLATGTFPNLKTFMQAGFEDTSTEP